MTSPCLVRFARTTGFESLICPSIRGAKVIGEGRNLVPLAEDVGRAGRAGEEEAEGIGACIGQGGRGELELCWVGRVWGPSTDARSEQDPFEVVCVI